MILHICLITLTLCFVSILLIKRFLYFKPSSKMLERKEDFTDVYLGNLHGLFKKGQTSKVILVCHGHTGNVSHYQDLVIKLLSTGHSVLIFDYSGYGLSKGVPNEMLCYSNAGMFVEYLFKNGYDKNDIIPYGHGIGSAVSIYTARRYNLPKLIIDKGVKSIKKIIKYNLPYVYPLSFLFPEFDTELYLKGYKGEILTLYSNVQNMFENSNISIDINSNVSYIQVIKDFIK